MHKQAERIKENRIRSIANSVAQKKSDVNKSLGFLDNRLATVVQRQPQEIVNNNSQAIAKWQVKSNAPNEKVMQRVKLGNFDTQNDNHRNNIILFLRSASESELTSFYNDLQLENGRNSQYYLEFIRGLWIDRQIYETPYRKDKVNIVVSIWINGRNVYQTKPWLSGYQQEFEEEFPFRELKPNPYALPDESAESKVSQNDAEVKAFFDAEDALESLLSVYGGGIHTIEFVITGNKGACDGCKMRRTFLENRARDISRKCPSAINAVISSREIYDDKKLGVSRDSRKYGVSSDTTYGRAEDKSYQSETDPKLKMFSDTNLPQPSKQTYGTGERVSDVIIPSSPEVNLMDRSPEQIQELVGTERALFFANGDQAFDSFRRGSLLLEQQFVMTADTPMGFAIFRIVQNPINPRQFHLSRCLKGG
ncbi:hypothetical protein [Pectobacterium brasiliense]|uniref:hypothetical protein n=1 Tax=Pectobacterium brasiliense TaxID=180957 RepID=UPI003D9AE91B